MPRFPVEGLARFADHADPAVRRRVARDPLTDPRLVERLVADPDATVRQAMASCPRLPAARIAAFLDHPDLAEHTAANPAMPVAEMWPQATGGAR